MSSAALRVFGTPERLENILWQLAKYDEDNDAPWHSIKDLFAVLRVSKTFKASIEGSIKLQRAMMLAYEEDSPNASYSGVCFLFDGPLWDVLAPCGPHQRISADGAYRNVDSVVIRPGKTVYIKTGATSAKDSFHVDSHWDDNTDDVKGQTASSNVLAPSASWRKMKLTDVPMHLMVRMLVSFDRPAASPSSLRAVIACDYYVCFRFEHGGETIGDLFDAISVVLGRDCEEHVQCEKERRKAVDAAMRYYSSGDLPDSSYQCGKYVATREAHKEQQHSHEDVMRDSCHFCHAESNIPLAAKEAKREGRTYSLDW